jgi:type IV secretory pathway VirB4 component
MVPEVLLVSKESDTDSILSRLNPVCSHTLFKNTFNAACFKVNDTISYT